MPDPPRQKAPAAKGIENSGMLAATGLPDVQTPKAPKGGGAALPDYRTSVEANTAQVAKRNFDVANVDIVTTYRSAADNATLIRNLARAVPEFAASRAAHLRLGIPEGYIAVARDDATGEFNVEATRLALQLCARMDYGADYENGFSHTSSLRSISEALAGQIWQNGACGVELVLDKSRLPWRLQPVAEEHVFFFEDGNALKPVQRIGGVDIDLDTPTYFRVALDPDLLSAYPASPMESAIQPVLASAQFLTDLRRLCQRHIYKRFDLVIDEEKLKARCPQAIKNDPAKQAAWLNGQLAALTTLIENLGVEDALIHFDFFQVKYIEGDQTDTPELLNVIPDIFNGKIHVGTKTPAAVLGSGASSASAANAEVLMFMVNVNASIRVKLMELHSKWLTLALRLLGQAVHVEFLYDEIELRPKSEISAYKQMQQSFWRQQLSDGYISDEEYCLRTTGALPRAGFVSRAGTYFMDSAAPAEPNTDPNATSTTSNMNQSSKPTQAKGVKK